MKVILANPRGFCAGVNMAVDVVDEVLRLRGAPVYVFHEIVHNKHVVDDFRSRGVTFVDEVEEVPRGPSSCTARTASRRTSGGGPRPGDSSRSTPPARWSPRSTWRCCGSPRTGTRSCSSGTGTTTRPSAPVGEAPDHITVVETEADVDALTVPDPDKVAYVTQTTLSVADAQRLIAA
jgi:4-hydroxy-3-methylbut-2-enyl diphosphate reductase